MYIQNSIDVTENNHSETHMLCQAVSITESELTHYISIKKNVAYWVKNSNITVSPTNSSSPVSAVQLVCA